MAAMTATDLAGYLTGQLAQLEAVRPGAARAGRDGGWESAQTALVAEVAARTGLPAEFVRGQLTQRELVRTTAQHAHEALRTMADTGFVATVLAAAAWTLAAGKPRAGKG